MSFLFMYVNLAKSSQSTKCLHLMDMTMSFQNFIKFNICWSAHTLLVQQYGNDLIDLLEVGYHPNAGKSYGKIDALEWDT